MVLLAAATGANCGDFHHKFQIGFEHHTSLLPRHVRLCFGHSAQIKTRTCTRPNTIISANLSISQFDVLLEAFSEPYAINICIYYVASIIISLTLIHFLKTFNSNFLKISTVSHHDNN